MSRGLQRRTVLGSSGSTDDGHVASGILDDRPSLSGSMSSSPAWHRLSAQELRSMAADDLGPPLASRTNTVSDLAASCTTTGSTSAPELPLPTPVAQPAKTQDGVFGECTPPSQGFIPEFSKEQKAILDLVVNGGESVFFTGAAGTGKSVLLRQIIVELKKRHKAAIAVTASTGMAACNINGCTLHRFAGIGIGNDTPSALIKQIRSRKQVKARWKRTQVLIIDEISMITGELFDKLDVIARAIRQTDRPFGGIQLVVTGDFFQLPPVTKGLAKDTVRNYAFLATQWPNVIRRTINLTEVFRQRDPQFIGILNEMRKGHVSLENERFFQELQRRPEVPEGIQPTRLFSRRDEVERANRTALAKIDSEEHVYLAVDEFKESDPFAEAELKNLMAPPEISLKEGAQVMMIKNIDEDLVNGSLGTVVGFEREYLDGAELLEAREERELENRLNHHSEEYNPAVFGLRGPANQDFHRVTDAVDRRKRLRMARLEELDSDFSRVLPVVRFFRPDGTFREMTVRPETWLINDPDNTVRASRKQIPLILAWAISIHKSQGQTLDWLTVDLDSVFEAGQAYVAISRARNPKGLQVFNFRRRGVFSDETVTKFYDSLESAGSFKPLAPRTVAEFFKNQPNDPQITEPKLQSAPQFEQQHDSSNLEQAQCENEVKQEPDRYLPPVPAYLLDLPPPPDPFDDLPPPPKEQTELKLPPDWELSMRPDTPDGFDPGLASSCGFPGDSRLESISIQEPQVYENYNFINPSRRFSH